MAGVTGNWTSGKDFILLPETRRYYFICGNGFCLQGMKDRHHRPPAPAQRLRRRWLQAPQRHRRTGRGRSSTWHERRHRRRLAGGAHGRSSSRRCLMLGV
uniref:Uncharacterized protein n=1 Tax=Arundo donax TaxID=35708 RepID=A0A0A9EWI2_ARUDO